MTTKTTEKAVRRRDSDLRRMLEDRRRELLDDVQGRIRGVRAEGTKEREAWDEGDSSESDLQEDIALALLQMQSETLRKVDEALRRLDNGTYGHCFECGDEIGAARLRALPFAVRCKDCEEARETARERDRLHSQRRGASPLLLDLST